MEVFINELMQFHGNGKHKQNWLHLKELFMRNSQLVEQAAMQKHGDCGNTLLLAYAQHISSNFRASLIVTLMLTFQKEFLSEDSCEVFISEVRLFFDFITPQEAECASEELTELAHVVTRLACESNCPAKVIPSLSRLSTTMSPNPNCLTAIHADILKACIAGGMFSFAFDFISNVEILEINPKKCFLEISDFLSYFYYCGVVYIAMKDFKNALVCFSEIMSFPALTPVHMEAYKKGVLLSLIVHGKSYSDFFPSDASPDARKLYQSAEPDDGLHAYRVIESLVLSGCALCESVRTDLAEDGNTSLAAQAVEAVLSHRLQRISKAYLSLSLSKLAKLIGGGVTPKGMEKYLVRMNEQGVIFATINNVTNIVTFKDLSSKFQDSPELITSLQLQLREAAMLSDKLRRMHADVLRSPALLKKALVTSRGEGSYTGVASSVGMGVMGGDMSDDMGDSEFD